MSNLTERNRQFFDKLATTHQTGFDELTKRAIQELQERRHWISDKWTDTDAGKDHEVKILDYACGAGAVSKAFAPFATKLMGVDLSENMVAEYNKTARDLNFPPTKMSAQRGDLLSDPIPEHLSGPEYHDFDVAAIGAALHHVESPGLVLKRLAARLRRGGVCLVMDHASSHDRNHDRHQEVESFFKENPDVAATVKTHGFAREEMQTLYEEAGLGKGFEYVIVEEPLEFTMNGRQRQISVFLARGELI